MRIEFVKEFKLLDKNDSEKNDDLIRNIDEIKNNLSNMHNNIQYAEKDLVDYYSYQIKAEEAKYSYLLKQAKSRNLKKE